MVDIEGEFCSFRFLNDNFLRNRSFLLTLIYRHPVTFLVNFIRIKFYSEENWI